MLEKCSICGSGTTQLPSNTFVERINTVKIYHIMGIGKLQCIGNLVEFISSASL